MSKTNIQKMVSATVCDICREEIDTESPRQAGDETGHVSFVLNGKRYDFHKACLSDYQFPDPRAVEAGSRNG